MKQSTKEKLYTVRIICGGCKEIMHESIDLTKKELKAKWVLIVMGTPLNVGSCKNGCRPTFSDCNMNTDLKIWDKEKQKYIDKDEFFG